MTYSQVFGFLGTLSLIAACIRTWRTLHKLVTTGIGMSDTETHDDLLKYETKGDWNKVCLK